MAGNNTWSKEGMQAPPNYNCQAGPSGQQNSVGKGRSNNNGGGGGRGSRQDAGSKLESIDTPDGWVASYSDTGRTTRTNKSNMTSSSRAPVPEGVDVFEFAGGAYKPPAEDVNFEDKYKMFGKSKQHQHVPNWNEDRMKKAAKLVAQQGVSFKEAARMCNVTQKDFRFYYDNHYNEILQLPEDYDPFGEDDDVYI